MKCARCGADNLDTSRYCGNCTAPLSVNSPASLVPTEVSVPRPPSSDPSDDGRFLPGTLLGERYRIISKLGAGGMGEVYRASDLRLSQQVALKFLPEEMARDPKALERFHNEVRIARQVAHPNVCRVYDIGEVEGIPYLSMEYVDGEDLNSLLRRIGRLPRDKAIEISRKLCAGLAAAHHKGVLHRDLKPGNIMIDGRGQVLITDFGLAGIAGQIQGAETRNGTPGYMAPEQLSGKEVSAQSDVYALGVVLYEIFTGKRPFNAATRAELIKQEEEGAPTSPRNIVKEIDPTVEDVILRCLSPDPRSRPASALAVSAALPGGDPLAAALAAGETPSPEMVAASGEKAGLRPWIAVSCLAASILGLVLWAFANQAFNVLFKLPLDNPPEVLAAKARDIARKLGYDTAASASAFGFEYRYGTMRLLHRLGDAHLASARPNGIAFWYRSSPVPMVPNRMAEIPRVTRSDPPEDLPGMFQISVDMQGRMRSFAAVPPLVEESRASWPAPDWTAMFSAAGLDQSHFKPADPEWTPSAMADARAAWTGSYPEEPGIPMRVEGAAYHGRPVSYMEILSPGRPATSAPASGRSTGDLVYLIVQLVVLIGSIPFARYNLKLARGDTRGAARLGLFALCVCWCSWLIGGTHVAGAGEADLFFLAVSRAVFGGVTLAVTYISFGPFVRRRWPQTMVGWSRVLGGQFRDPLVGRDVLYGVLIGILLDLVLGFGSWLYAAFHIRGFRVTTDPITLTSTRFLAGQFLFTITDTLNKSLGILFLIFLTRALLRKQWVAACLVTVVLAGIYAPNEVNPWIGWGVNFLFFGLMVFTLMRFGLLAMAIAILIAILLNQYPLTTDFSVWYSGAATFTVVVTAAIVLFGFRTSLARQPLFKGD